jgi:hypothetical protein
MKGMPQLTNEQQEQVFHTMKLIQPLCNTLINPLSPHIDETLLFLKDLLPSLPDIGVNHYTDYLLFPLHQLLQQHPFSSRSEVVVYCMQLVLSRSRIDSEAQFSELFQALVILVSNNQSSEELKKVALLCLKTLIQTPTNSSLAVHPLIAHSLLPVVIATLLDIGSSSQKMDRQLRIASVKTLSSIIECIASSEMLQKIFPGLASGLGKMIISDFKVGTEFKVVACEVWTQAISLVMNDEHNKHSVAPSAPISLDSLREYIRDNSAKQSKPQKTDLHEKWLVDAASHLHKSIIMIYPSSSSRRLSTVPIKWKLKLALAHSASQLIHQCSKTLSHSVPILVEVLALYSQDEHPEVSKYAQTQCTELGQSSLISFSSLLESNLHQLLGLLPVLVCTRADDVNKMIPLKLVAGM